MNGALVTLEEYASGFTCRGRANRECMGMERKCWLWSIRDSVARRTLAQPFNESFGKQESLELSHSGGPYMPYTSKPQARGGRTRLNARMRAQLPYLSTAIPEGKTREISIDLHYSTQS
jgi:hypothetical protein